MPKTFTRNDIIKWTEIIFSPDQSFLQDITDNWRKYKKIFIDKIAKFLYEDLFPNSDFEKLKVDKKNIWFDYVEGIPAKLESLNLFISPFKEYCRTCLITDGDIEKLAHLDQKRFSVISSGRELEYIKSQQNHGHNRDAEHRLFFMEVNYLIPSQIKKIGFEIIRPAEVSEIDMVMIRKLARAIHSRYLKEIRNQEAMTGKASDFSVSDSEYSENKYITEYANLPEDIKYSNEDNAYHIPTKLLSIGYKIRPVQKGYKSRTLHLDDAEIETMAKVEHLRWSWDKRLNGWSYGNVKDITKKIHPGLIPFEKLSELEKDKDRELVKLIPGLLQDIEYEAFPINPERIKNLSYAIKPQSSIHKLLNETRELNDEIRSMASANPVIDDKVRIINNKIIETIAEVEGNYNYASQIQEAFLPDDLYVRECFPDSFILYKPKDVISGDFYFFSKNDNLITFAVADCTGHGIPGALISTIGYGITDQAVNELKLTNPSEILQHLYSRVHKFLREDEEGTGLYDDMDIVICSLDVRTNILTFSGVRNPMYHISGNSLVVHKANNVIEPCYLTGECKFVSESVKLKPGDSIYLCSDGYADQFGGLHHKRFKSDRLSSFLLNIQDYSMPEQNDKLYEEIEKWREENNEDQTDDILVIGIRI